MICHGQISSHFWLYFQHHNAQCLFREWIDGTQLLKELVGDNVRRDGSRLLMGQQFLKVGIAAYPPDDKTML